MLIWHSRWQAESGGNILNGNKRGSSLIKKDCCDRKLVRENGSVNGTRTNWRRSKFRSHPWSTGTVLAVQILKIWLHFMVKLYWDLHVTSPCLNFVSRYEETAAPLKSTHTAPKRRPGKKTTPKNEFWLDYDCCPTPLWMVWFDQGISISIQKASSGSDWSNPMSYGSFPHRQMCSEWPVCMASPGLQ